MTEWRSIPGWPEYEVSDAGRVRRIVPGRRGSPAGELKPTLFKCGYFVVTLCALPRIRKRYVHELVCESFHGPKPSPRHEVGHRDGVYTNNVKDNVRWVTRKENCDDSDRHGTRLRGDRQNGAKLTAEDVRAIRQRLDCEQQKIIAEAYGVSPSTIQHIAAGNTWRHVL